ncbi:MAG: trypsin-like peptidase domain-containing protein [Phycisphaerales bacterium]|nr:trypsin-like peptidase domain-containing protein [Phycisphaerales bacterium]
MKRIVQSLLRIVVAAAASMSFEIALGDEIGAVELLKDTQERFRSAAARVQPSLVRIETVGGTPPSLRSASEEPEPKDDDLEGPPAPKRTQNPFRDTVGSGFVVADGPTTGLVYSSDGYIVTSSFNFVREPALISVTLSDGRRLAADLVARDQVRKIALLKVEADGLAVPEWVNADDVRVGEWAIALGMGFGGESVSITVGIVSALNRMAGNAIQTDAKLSPANYGGPLCDIRGRVIGISVPMAQRPGELAGAEMYDSGVGFAVPRHRLDAIVAELMKGRSFHRGWLGVSLDPRARDTVVVGNIADPSPAREAGVRIGDKIISIAGKPVKHFGQLVQALYMIPAGETVRLELERGGEPLSLDVVLAETAKLGPLPEIAEPFDPANPIEPAPEETPTPEEVP